MYRGNSCWQNLCCFHACPCWYAVGAGYLSRKQMTKSSFSWYDISHVVVCSTSGLPKVREKFQKSKRLNPRCTLLCPQTAFSVFMTMSTYTGSRCSEDSFSSTSQLCDEACVHTNKFCTVATEHSESISTGMSLPHWRIVTSMWNSCLSHEGVSSSSPTLIVEHAVSLHKDFSEDAHEQKTDALPRRQDIIACAPHKKRRPFFIWRQNSF